MKAFEVVWESGYTDRMAKCPVCENIGLLSNDFTFLGGGHYKCPKCSSLLKEIKEIEK